MALAIRTPSATPATEPISPVTALSPRNNRQDLAAGRAKRTQNTDLIAAFGHRDRERVVDDKHADEESEQTRNRHHQRVGREQRLELLPASRRWRNLKTRSEQRLELTLAVGDCSMRLDREINAVELPTAAEHLLRAA